MNQLHTKWIVSIAIAIFVNYYRSLATIDVDEGDVLRG